MKRIERLQAITLFLQNRRTVRALDIAKEFGITLRTVYRDIASLRESGTPINGEAGVGYQLDRNFHLKPIQFTEEESIALLTVAKFFDQFPDKSTKQNFDQVIQKIRSSLPETTRDQIEFFEAKITVPHFQNSVEYHPRQDFLKTIRNSLYQKKVLDLQYFSGYARTRTMRKVEALGLVFYARHWHLIAWCQMKQDYRDFRLDRIEEIKLTEHFFSDQNRLSLNDYGKLQMENLKLIPTDVYFHRKVVDFISESSFLWGFTGISQPEEDWIRMRFTVADKESFCRWVLSFTKWAKIVSPYDLLATYQKIKAELSEEPSLNTTVSAS